MLLHLGEERAELKSPIVGHGENNGDQDEEASRVSVNRGRKKIRGFGSENRGRSD